MAKTCFLSFLFSLLLISSSVAGKINTGWFSNLAVKGYDVVAYHKENKAIKGSEKYSYKYQKAEWHFSSEENLNLFKENPTAYVPQYGGYCAFAVASGDAADIDPKVFSIHEGKLYLNYNPEIGKKWEANKLEFIKKADIYWENNLK